MNKWKLGSFALCVVILALCLPAEAQQAKSVPRIGFLSRDLHPSDSRASPRRNLEAFRQGLRELGYVEGKNIIIEYRYAEGRVERLSALAEELLRLNIEIIVTDTTASARAAKKMTSTIPIVIASGSDPIQSGLVVSLAKPGGNVTGLTNLNLELLGKRLELLKEVVPKVSRFAFLDDDDTRYWSELEIAQKAADTLGAKLERISKARSKSWPRSTLAALSQAQAHSAQLLTERKFWSWRKRHACRRYILPLLG
jgi:putative tryptophan/tyrosine transport system substrate-binding protein